MAMTRPRCATNGADASRPLYNRKGGKNGEITAPILAALLLLLLLLLPCASPTSLLAKLHALRALAMGRKSKNNASTVNAAVVKKVPGEWAKSTVTERMLNAVRKNGLLPAADSKKVRVPGDEVIPRPNSDERVCFVDFVNRGFSFPVHEFVRGLMYAYGVQLHDFTPNAILHIACFITMCECFLGISPHWGLWRRISS